MKRVGFASKARAVCRPRRTSISTSLAFLINLDSSRALRFQLVEHIVGELRTNSIMGELYQ